MPPDFSLAAEKPKRFTGHEECLLLENAHAQGRASLHVILRLAKLYNRLDRFDKTLTLLDSGDIPANYQFLKTRIEAHLGLKTQENYQLALHLALAAEHLAQNSYEQANALNYQAKIRMKRGEPALALALFHQATERNPRASDAMQRLINEYLGLGKSDKAFDIINALRASGVLNSQILGCTAQAQAQVGDYPAARQTINLAQTLATQTITAPSGWNDLASFNAAISQEIMTSPGMRHGRFGTASISSLRVDEPVTQRTPALQALQTEIIARITDLVADQSGDDAWFAFRPKQAKLRMWCIITNGDGWERWHMHSMGWATGGYYAAVPDSVVHGSGAAGCLEFGLPDHRLGMTTAQAYGTTLLRPKPGLLSFFPSHAYHRTHPHHSDQHRICLAFDVMPA